MDFNQVRYFLALADTLNFTRAAEQCYVSQPALTQAIKRLETELGGELINRISRENELTELGRSLKKHFEVLDKTRHIVRSTAKAVIEGEISEINIGILCTIGPQIIGSLFYKFHLDNPMVSIILHDVTPSNYKELLLKGVLEGAFIAQHAHPDPQLKHIELFEEDMVIAFPSGHRFSKTNKVSLREIAYENYLERLHCEFREEFQKLFIENGLDLQIVFRCQREDWIQNLVSDGLGVSLIPQYSLLRPEIEFRPVLAPSLFRKIEFVTSNRANTKPALSQLIEYIKTFNWNSRQL